MEYTIINYELFYSLVFINFRVEAQPNFVKFPQQLFLGIDASENAMLLRNTSHTRTVYLSSKQ